MRKTFVCLLALVLLCLSLQPMQASAASTRLDPSEPCSLTLHYDTEGTGFPDLEISIYRFAQVQASMSLDLVAPYNSLPVNIHGITTQQEWDTVASTLSAYIAADGIPATHSAKTDSEGTVCFTGLQSGLYLVSRVVAKNDDGTYVFDSFVILLPAAQDNSFHYDVEANPKCSEFLPAEEYSVIKLWKDSGDTSLRPESITVEILRDGILMETVVLGTDNNWSYTWKVQQDDAGIWSVAEKDVPDAYQVAVTQNGFTFTITNSRPTTPTTPQTGDSFPLIPVVLLMCVSGSLIILLEALRRRHK